MSIYRSKGGYSGVTDELDSYVVGAAKLLESTFGDVEIRFNSDRQSGGAFLADLPYNVGITVDMRTLTRMRELWARHPDWETFETLCERVGVIPEGPEVQHVFHCFIDAHALKAAHGLTWDRETYVHPRVADVAAGLALLRSVVNLDQKEVTQ